MLPKERVAAIFEHEPTDRVPIYMGSFSSRVASEVLGRPNACVGGGVNQFYESCAWWEGEDAHAAFEERCFQDAMDLPTALDLDYVRPAYWRLREKPTRRIDEFTFLYGDPDGAYRVMRFDPDTELYQIIDQQPRRQTTVEDIERQVEAMERGLPDFQPTEAIAADWQRAMEVHGETRAVQSGGVGVGIPREPAWLEATALRPDLVGRYLTLLGGINSATLHRGIRDDVVRETMAALEVAHECGSLMVGCSNLIVCQTPMASFEAMMETLWANR